MRLIDADAIPWEVAYIGEFPVITKEEIDSMPTVEAEPARHGKWIYGEHEIAMCDGYRCSKCGYFVPWDYGHKSIDYINEYHYCPSCGAKMDGEHEAD